MKYKRRWVVDAVQWNGSISLIHELTPLDKHIGVDFTTDELLVPVEDGEI